MDNNHLSISTNAALKSELLKAKLAFDMQRASKPPMNPHKHTRLQAKSRTPPKYEESTANATSWETCHASLLSKSKYYEECLESSHFDDTSENALVDFPAKDCVTIAGAFHPSSNSSEWVECIDEFGRNRIVRKNQEPFSLRESHSFSEVRNRSVGFFQLSTNEAHKQQQLDTLRTLHHSTLEARAMNSLIKEQKRLKMQRSLALASNRRLGFIFDGQICLGNHENNWTSDH